MKRILYIDYVKAIAILLVVWAHFVTYGITEDPITCAVHDMAYAFHMPLFAIVSGLFFSCMSEFIPFIKRKITQLILPLLFWGIIYVLVYRIPYDIRSLIYNGERIHLQAYVRDLILTWTGMSWFLKSLFLCFIYYYIICRICHRNKKSSGVISVILLYISAFIGLIPNKLQFVDGAIFLFPFFVFGSFILDYKEKIIQYKNHIFCFSLIVFLFLYFFFWKHSYCWYTTNTNLFIPSLDAPSDYVGLKLFGIIVLRFIVGAVGSLVIFSAFAGLKPESNIYNKDLLATIGSSTLGIYIIQDLVLSLLRGLLIDFNIVLSSLVSFFLSIMLVVLSSLLVYHTSKKKFSLFLWGK